MCRVARARGAIPKDGVIGSLLRFGAQTRDGKPDKRMEPEQHAGDCGHDIREMIAARHVRELMDQHHTSPLGRPIIRIRR